MDLDWLCLNGTLVRPAEGTVPAVSQGLLYGLGLFETFRARGGRVFRLERHFERLCQGAGILRLPVPVTFAALEASVVALTARCSLEDARLRLTVAAGASDSEAIWLVTIRSPDDYPETLYSQGIAVVVASVRRNEGSPLTRVKSLNYLDNLLARREARRSRAQDAILLNSAGFVAEGSGANLFAIRGRELATPPVEDGALPGITREAVMELAGEAGLTAIEKSLSIDEVATADEVFLTNAVAGVLPAVRLNEASIGRGTPGPLTRALGAAYLRAVTAL